MTPMGRKRTKHRGMPAGAKLVRGRWYVVATNKHLARIISERTGGKKSMPLAPGGQPAPTDQEAARRYYAATFLRPLADLEDATTGTVAELVALARSDLLAKYRTERHRAEAGRHLDVIGAEWGARRYARNAVEASQPGTMCLRALDVQRWLYERRNAAPVAANRLVATMSGMFRLARSLWGKTEYNPCDGVTRNRETPRHQLPTPEQFDAIYAHAPEWLQCMMLIARDYSRRRGEILGLSDHDVTPAGLVFMRGKRRREILVEWDVDLRAVVGRLQAWRDRKCIRVRTLRLIVNSDGNPVTETGFASAWKRARAAAGIDADAVHFHDLRAIRPSGMTSEQATRILAHDDPATARKVYQRGPITIRSGEFGNEFGNTPNSETAKRR